jgi:uncharacterized repeat protein (TIGR03943 family)
MDPRTQGALLLAVGGVALRLAVSGTALNFIKPGYVPLLGVSGGVLVVLGAITLWTALREPRPGHAAAHAHDGLDHDGHDHDGLLLAGPEPVDVGTPSQHHAHGHDHSRGPRVAWMLAAPLFAVLLIAPPPLGSYAAARQSGVVRPTTSAFPDLPAAVDGAVPLSLGEYAARALYDTDRSLEGQRVRLVGFVSEVLPDGFVLTRFAMSCCAADGTAVNVEVRGGEAPPVDQWVEVDGTWVQRPDHVIGELTADPPILEAAATRPVPQPAQPYES